MLRFAAALAIATPVAAQDIVWTEYDGSFDDAAFSVEQAIIGEGLVIDFVSDVGTMLERTAADVGEASPIDKGKVFLTCSALVTREVLSLAPENLAYCPYAITVLEVNGSVRVGREDYPPASMDPAEALLDRIIEAAN